MATVIQSFTGTGTGTVCPTLKSGIISISGTFVGTVQVLIDALGTGQQSYHMLVNPSGVQLDMLNSASGASIPGTR